MDDLSGLDWSSKPQDQKKPAPLGSASAFAALRPTPPISGRSTPLNGIISRPSSKPATPANDSFSNLVSFTSAASNKNLSLQEQQKILLDQKAKQESTKLGVQYNGANEQFWDILGSGRSTPLPEPQSQIHGSISSSADRHDKEEEADILAAFNSAATVDSSSHFSKPNVRSPQPAQVSKQGLQALHGYQNYFTFDDDDDPFGLSNFQQSRQTPKAAQAVDFNDDDVLGLLGKPLSDIPIPKANPQTSKQDQEDIEIITHPQDQAIAELMEMGFPADKARQALESTGSGTDIQAAVGWLLNQAHVESRQRSRARDGTNGVPGTTRQRSDNSRTGMVQEDREMPAWSRSDRRTESDQRPTDNATPSNVDKDPAQIASELSATFLKTAGSLWKTSTKKVQQAVQEFNSDSDSSQPRWMKEPAVDAKPRSRHERRDENNGRRRRRSSASKKADLVTDEAMMLESDQARPAPRKPARPRQEPRFDSSADNSRDHSPAVPSRLREQAPAKPAFLRQQQQQPPSISKAHLNRQAVDDQASQAYVSSARRRKAAVQPPVSVSNTDLLDGVTQTQLLLDLPPLSHLVLKDHLCLSLYVQQLLRGTYPQSPQSR